MVTCKFYQSGNCRNQNCGFDHVNNFGRQGNERSVGIKNIVVGVAKELQLAKRGGQWPLSCFGPFKDQPCIPGFEDVSPEEVRWEIYQAQKNNTLELAKQQFHQLCQQATAKRKAFKKPTHKIATMLEKLKEGTSDPQGTSTLIKSNVFSSNSSGTFQPQSNLNPFNAHNFTPATSLFTGATNSPSIYGTNNFSVHQNVFAGANSGGSIFGSTGNLTSNLKANTLTSNTSANLFTKSATASSPGIFSSNLGNNNVSSNTLFGQKSTVTFGAPAFGNTPNFGNSAVFNQPQLSATNTNNNILGNNPAANAFGTKCFNSASTTSITTISTPSLQPFNVSSNTGPTTTTTISIKPVRSNPFASSTQPFVINNPFGSGIETIGTSSINSNCYTLADALTEEEKTSFTADKFVLQRIPLRPPSIEIR